VPEVERTDTSDVQLSLASLQREGSVLRKNTVFRQKVIPLSGSWSNDSLELTAVFVAMSGGRIEVSEPRRLADAGTFPEPVFQPNGYRSYGVASNGQRFLILLPPTERPSVPVTMILNGTTAPAKN